MRSRIRYIEYKGNGLEGPGRIGRVTFSKTGRTVYYGGKSLQRLGGQGFKSNHFDVQTGEEYWISGPKRNGQDRMYSGGTKTPIDQDVRVEYWREIRKRSDLIDQPHT